MVEALLEFSVLTVFCVMLQNGQVAPDIVVPKKSSCMVLHCVGDIRRRELFSLSILLALSGRTPHSCCLWTAFSSLRASRNFWTALIFARSAKEHKDHPQKFVEEIPNLMNKKYLCLHDNYTSEFTDKQNGKNTHKHTASSRRVWLEA